MSREEGAAMNPQMREVIVLRTGARRVIPRWEFGHLRALGYARLSGGVVLTTCSLLTLRFGGDDLKTYEWAAAFLVLAALNVAGGLWELTIARSADTR
jgi:hypothetical protein